MKILYITHAYPPHGSGVGTVVQGLARGMAARGHQVWVLENYHPVHGPALGRRQDGEVQVIQFGVRFWLFQFFSQKKRAALFLYRLAHKSGLFLFLLVLQAWRCGKAAAKLAAGEKIDLIEIPDGNEGGAFAVSLPAFTKLVVRLHGSVHLQEAAGLRLHSFATRKIFKTLERHAIRRAAGLVSVSKYVASQATRIFHPKKTVEVIHNALESFEPAASQSRTQPIVLSAGRLCYDKGTDALMHIWNLVHKQVPGAQLIVVGEGDIKSYRKMLTPEAHPTVHFKGKMAREALLKLMEQVQCFVLPSRYESFGLVILEAMQRGCPVVCTTLACGPEMVEQQVSGLLANPDKPADFAAAIITLLQNEALREKLRTGAEIQSEKHLHYKEWIIQNEAFYTRVLSGSEP